MRINNISTFGSKPVLNSQIDEILASKNVTMQGNNVNSPGGLLVLTNEGKIPENTDIQRVFYIGDTFPSANIEKNSLYVSSTGESRATNDNAEYINISLQVVTDFSTVSDDTVVTSQAIKTYVDNSIANIATETSGVLSAYATIEYVDNKVANISTDVQHIFYVEDFPEVSSAVANSIYVNKNTKESRIFDGTEFASMSLKTVTDFSTVGNDTLATTQAISSFVDEKIAAIDIPNPDLSAYQPISGMSNYALKTDIPEEVVYVDAFPTSGITNAIYVTPKGESKLWNGSEFISISYEISDNFVGASPSAVASVGAVIDYVSSTVPSILPENITTQGNEFNSGNQLVQLVNGKIPENLYNGDTQHIFYVDEFPVSGVENSIYVKNNSETKLYVSGTFVPMSVEVATDILSAPASSIVSVSAVKTYLSGYYADKAYVTDAITSAMLSGEVDLTPYAKTEWVTTELAKKADLSSLVDHIYYVSALPDTSSAISGSIYIISGSTESVYFTGTEFVSFSLETVTDFSTVTNDTLATTQAISAFVDEKISNIDIPSTDLSNYYNKTESDEKFALKDDVNSKLALSIVEDFPTSGINNTLYVNNENHAQIYANDQWKDIATEVVENFDTPSQTTVPTTEAVSSFVDEKISNIDIPSTDLSNYYTKTEVDDKFITSANIPEEVVYTSEFPTSGVNNAIYVNEEGQSKIYANDNWIDMSLKVDTEITADAVSSVPTTKAVYDLVSSISGTPVDLTNYNGNVSLHTTNSEQGWMASYFVADGQKIQMEYTNAENNSFAIASSNFVGIGVYKTDGKESIEITNNNISISASNLTYNGFNTNTGNGLVELVDGKIPSGLYDITNIPDNTLLVESVSDFPTSGTNNTMYIADSSEVRIYTDGEWKNISIEVAENFDTPNQTTVPTTQAVKDYVDANSVSNLTNYYTKTESDDKYALKTAIPSLSGYYTKIESDDKYALKTAIPSLSGYYTKTESDDKYALKTAIPDTSSFITNSVSNLTNYYTKTESDDKYALKTAIPDTSSFITNSVSNLTNYYTKTESDNKYALKTEINNPEQKTEVTTRSIVFKKNISIYKIEVSNSTTFTFNFNQLDNNNCYTFELWVSMSTPVTLTFPSNVAWLNDEVPDMSEISTYCIVVRKLPSTMGTSTITSPKALLNLAYQYQLVLG